ncbi:putative transglycosylase SLT domain 1, LysM domain, Lysozyme-like domain superfamily [Septoria linicola]|nr:putative transglycosylase SLT domain 1, LysM domain, Lysozyme-like domain superfamily [Septoria linicola]
MPYTVQSGDTFWSISQKLGISLQALEAANPGVAAANLQVGQVLNVPGAAPPVAKYTIVPGDTLWSISRKVGNSLGALQAANPGIDAANLQIGQVITLPSGSGSGQAPAPAPPRNGGPVPSGGNYVAYSGPASNFPDPRLWADWETLWAQNSRLMKFHDSDSEIALIQGSINTVSGESGVDRRVILCIIVQESGGNVRVRTTNNGVRNPGLMQSHNGVEFNPADPAGSILQMIRDGTSGTQFGDGLKQCYARYGNWYEAFRAYNSGSVNRNDLNDPVSATAHYVRDAANRLMGHTWNGM